VSFASQGFVYWKLGHQYDEVRGGGTFKRWGLAGGPDWSFPTLRLPVLPIVSVPTIVVAYAMRSSQEPR
jgi:hypothetical protein